MKHNLEGQDIYKLHKKMTKRIFLLFSIFLCVNGDYDFYTKYFEVPLDHFSFTSNATFKIRYLVNDSYHVERGPIFFYTGNEGDISMFAQNTGFMFDIAKQFNALIIFAEHRYYGESLPFGNKSYDSPAHLGYLSSEQALADFVDLIDFLQKTYSVTKDLKRLPVVAFGGSYGGMLSSWLRMKYPGSVIGAIASSAPIWQFDDLVPCENYYRITTNVYEIIGSKTCRRVIQDSWAIIRNMAKNDTGKSELVNVFKLCDPLTNEADIDKLIDWLANLYIDIAMINYPYPTNFLAPIPANPVREFCSRIPPNTMNPDILQQLSNAIQIYTNGTGKTNCNSFGEQSNLGLLGWDFQTCTEMTMPFCSTDGDMFENQPWDFKKFSDNCFKQWGVRPRNEKIAILQYGGKNLETYSNIVFSNGLFDPWSSGGVLTNISSSVVAVIIPNGAHHFDLRAQNPKDTVFVQEARQFHVRHIHKWLNEYYFANLMDPLKYQFMNRL